MKIYRPLTWSLLFIGMLTMVPIQTYSQTAIPNNHGATHVHSKSLMLSRLNAPDVSIIVTQDVVSGWNVQVKTTNFKFAPEHASGKHIPGEGHGHLYINDIKISRLYGPWFHISKLPTPKSHIKVTLNANDHRAIMVDGKVVAATAYVTHKTK